MTDKIEVSQRAREAAAALWESKDGVVSINAVNTRLGGMDDLPTVQAFARFERDILATRTDATPVADSDETFLTAYVSANTNIIGIDHPTEAPWQQVYDAHLALRDRLNERLEQEDLCPYKPKAGTDTRPPATDVAALVEAAKASAEGWANVVEFNLLPVKHWHSANDLQRQLRQALAPFTKG